MNTFQLFTFRGLLFSASICGLLLLTNCAGVVTTLDQYSGETLYESAVESPDEMLGFVPHIQTEVNKHLETDEQRQVFEAFQQDFVTQLVEQNPGLAREFYDKLHSGDRQQIHAVLNDAGRVVERELQNLTGQNEITAKNVVEAVMDKYDVQ